MSTPRYLTEASATNPLLLLVACGFFMQTLDATIVNTALPAMAHSMGESPLRMQSVIVAYSLTMAILIPASGWVADRFGTRRTFFGAIVLFALGSLACALSHSLGQIVAARVLQAAGGALMSPVGRLAVLRTFPRGQFLRAMGFVAVPGLVGPLVGPTLGGWLVQYASWHWIFLINLPVGLAGCIATLVYMPDYRAAAAGRFDLSGYLMLAFGMAAVSLSLDGVSELGLREGAVVLLLVFGLASLAAYWLHALRRPDPLFAPSLFSTASLRVGLLGNLFSRLGSSCMPFLIPLILQVSLGYTPAQAGMMLLPVATAGIATKALAARLITRYGYRRVLITNTVVLGVLMMTYALLSPAVPLWLMVIQFTVFGAVNSLQFTAMNTVTLKDLDGASASSGNSLLSMVQMLAMGLGVAAAGSVLAGYTSYFGGTGGAGAHTLLSFQATFVTMGLLTIVSAWMFWQLDEDAGGAPKKVEQMDTDAVENV